MVELPPILQGYNGNATLQGYAKKYIPAQLMTEIMRLLSYSWLVLQHKGAITTEVFRTSNSAEMKCLLLLFFLFRMQPLPLPSYPLVSLSLRLPPRCFHTQPPTTERSVTNLYECSLSR